MWYGVRVFDFVILQLLPFDVLVRFLDSTHTDGQPCRHLSIDSRYGRFNIGSSGRLVSRKSSMNVPIRRRISLKFGWGKLLRCGLDHCVRQCTQNVELSGPHHWPVWNLTQANTACRYVPTSLLRFHVYGCWAKIENYISFDFV